MAFKITPGVAARLIVGGVRRLWLGAEKWGALNVSRTPIQFEG